MDDVTIVQEKKGNCDEINIDKVCLISVKHDLKQVSF